MEDNNNQTIIESLQRQQGIDYKDPSNNNNNDGKIDESTITTTKQKQPRRNRRAGRAARRRYRKWLEIENAEKELYNNEGKSDSTTTTTNASILMEYIPQDRDRIWPAVQEIRNSNNDNNNESLLFTINDEKALIRQLGYSPGNAIQVVTRVKDISFLLNSSNSDDNNKDDPVVLKLYPIVIRDEHDGGKTGRKKHNRKKARRRIAIQNNTKQQQQQQEQEDESSCVVDNDDDKHKKEEKNNDDNNNNHCNGEDILEKNDTTTTFNDNGTTTTNNIDNNNNNNIVIEPFPTIYWLTYPKLRILISKLELEGYGIQLEKRLLSNDTYIEKMKLAHTSYSTIRYNILTSTDIQMIQNRNWISAFDTTGIAGNRNYNTVKCLHAHTAHYLSNDIGSENNIIGKWVIDELLVQNRFIS